MLTYQQKVGLGVGIALLAIILLFVLVLTLSTVTCNSGTYNEFGYCVPVESVNGQHSVTWQDVKNAPALIINLDKSTDRLETCTARLKEQGYTDIRRFKAVYGRDHEILVQEWTHFSQIKDTQRQHLFSTKVAEQGCLFSWLRVLEHIIENKYPVVSVFEDDIIFTPEFSEYAENYWNDTPANWDMIYMGFMKFFTLGKSKIVRRSCYCMHAVMFTYEGAKKIYDLLMNLRPVQAIDRMLLDLQHQNPVSYQWYCWNGPDRDLRYLATGMRGLVMQDSETFVSNIR